MISKDPPVTVRPRYRRPTQSTILDEINRLTPLHKATPNKRDRRSRSALQVARIQRIADPRVAQDALWQCIIRMDKQCTKTRRVGDIAYFNALAWAGGYTKCRPHNHQKTKITIEVGSPVSRPSRL